MGYHCFLCLCGLLTFSSLNFKAPCRMSKKEAILLYTELNSESTPVNRFEARCDREESARMEERCAYRLSNASQAERIRSL